VSDASIELPDEDHDHDPDIRELRQRAKAVDRAEAETRRLERRIAILESGLDVESPIGQLWNKSYQGEVTPEALKAEAERYGIPMRP
jgi:hypothetical protein